MSGDQGRGQQLIVGCLTASAAVAAGSSLAEGRGPGFRLVLGVTATAVGLATINMFDPDLAGGFAVLVLTTTVFVYGGPFMDAISMTLGKPPVTARGGKVRSKPNDLGSVTV